MKETDCSGCINCAPNDKCGRRLDFVFPENYECLIIEASFPKRCGGFCTPEPLWKYDTGGGSIIK